MGTLVSAMCSRYTMKSPAKALQDFLALEEMPSLKPRYNAAPSQELPIVTALHPRELTWARWGLIPSWTKGTVKSGANVNARGETVMTLATFRDSFAKRRCLVPVDGFYEWKHSGRQALPFHVHRRSNGLFTLGGIWDNWRAPNGAQVVSFSIITTPPVPPVNELHDRMPLVIDKREWKQWLSSPAQGAQALIHPWTTEELEVTALDTRVNSVAHDDEACLQAPVRTQLPLL
jgi:putative SOS response-associated peptidase YedK